MKHSLINHIDKFNIFPLLLLLVLLLYLMSLFQLSVQPKVYINGAAYSFLPIYRLCHCFNPLEYLTTHDTIAITIVLVLFTKKKKKRQFFVAIGNVPKTTNQTSFVVGIANAWNNILINLVSA